MNRWVDSLQAFLPGMLVLHGALSEAIHVHAVHMTLWERFSALPERFNVVTKQPVCCMRDGQA